MTHSIMNKTGITGWNDVILDVLLKWHMKCDIGDVVRRKRKPGGNQPINVMGFSTSCYKNESRSWNLKLTIIQHLSYYNIVLPPE